MRYLIPETWCRFLCRLTDVSITTDQRAGKDPLARCAQSLISGRLWAEIDLKRPLDIRSAQSCRWAYHSLS